MEQEVRDNDVYGLVGQLCESLFRQHHRLEEHPYLPQQDNERHLRRLRAKAYEILLNKSDKGYSKEDQPCDPVQELLKHAFVLKVGAGRVSQAAELERYLDEFIDAGLESDSVAYSTLQFLNCLKSLDSEDDSSLDVFHYGKPHPQLPEMLYDESGVPPFQVYPIESFYLPKKFECMLKQESSGVIKYNAAEPGSKMALLGRFLTPINNNVKIRNRNDVDPIALEMPTRANNLLRSSDSTLSSYFMPQIKNIEESEDQLQICKEGIVTEPESPWQCQDPLQWFAHNGLTVSHHTEICEIEDNNVEDEVEDLDRLWECMDKDSPVSNYRTWETLGSSEPPKEPPFISESVDATLHLMNIAEGNILSGQIQLLQPIREVSCKEFISNIKLLLLGVESSTFTFSPVSGFELKKNVAIHGISTETLENLCLEVSRWGTCYRNLSDLIVPDPSSGKLQIEGLIFKALCNSLKEFLLFYHAAILRVSITEDGNVGLLRFLKKVRPLGHLISKVAELCRCDSQRLTSLGEGIGILTHIYKEVTKVTEQNVALVFYSILRDCCEVYFRFLQHWIFEGVCADIYDEFMIKVRPQYLRIRGHRFWTRAFIINEKSVPGFLADLTETILQCGKAITLLRICDPQNPLCRVSTTSQPPVRVCLSVGMLREQAKFYEDYTTKGEIEQGEEVSLHSAIQGEKDAERERAQLVIAAQQGTLLRLKKEREDALRQISKEKSDLLVQLKDQAEQAAQRKERDRNAELLADKILMENIMKQEEEDKNIEKAERENTKRYYEELAEEARKRHIRADWRIRRMKLFDERVLAIANLRREFVNTPDTPKSFDNIEVKSDEQSSVEVGVNKAEDEKSAEDVKVDLEVDSVVAESVQDGVNVESSGDENSNPSSTKVDEANKVQDEQNQNTDQDSNKENVNTPTTTKAVRPTVLDVTQNYSNDLDKLDGIKKTQSTNKNDGMTEAQRNRLKVLQHEFGTESTSEKTDTNSNPEETAVLTEAQRNKLKVLQREFERTEEQGVGTDVNLNLSDTSNLTEAQRNKLKVLQSEFQTIAEEKTDNKLFNPRGTDNLTDAQRNRLKVLQSEFGITPNNNESATILNSIENSDKPTELTEMQMNKLRNTQHWNQSETQDITNQNEDECNPNKTEIQHNRLRNTQHLTHLNCNDNLEILESGEKLPLTEAQLNRNKVMSHTYNRELEPIIKSEILNDRQKYRNRNMAHNTDQFDFEINRFLNQDQHQRETPMSTTTDHFTVSTYSSLPVHSCENTPYSEITNHSDMLFARSSDGGSTDEPCQSRCSKHFHDTPAFPNFIGLGSIPNTPSMESQQLTIADVEMIDNTSLQVYLEKSVVTPLMVQSRLVNSALIKYLLNEHKMLSHLHSLRSYFFLLNGEFAKTLTHSLFTRLYEASSPVELFNSSTLTNFLEKAIVSSLSSTYANSELLSLSAVDVPAILQTSNPEILNCLSLNYKISWPLNIIFNDIVMQQYSKVFKFLLMVGRVLWVLQEDFHILKIERKASISQNHHKLQLYRHSMMQFMNALHTYLTCSVLHASWTEFEKDLGNAATIDQVYDIHVSYIKKILSRCMLNVRGEKMRTCLCNIFKVVLKFHNRIRLQNWSDPKSAMSLNYDNLEKMYVTFCEQRAYLAHVAEKLASSGYQPHLMQFLHALNINHRYDLVKRK